MKISEDLQKAIIGCIISQPYLADELGGVYEAMFSDSFGAVFIAAREQALNDCIDLHLLQAKAKAVNLPVGLSEIIGHTDTNNFNQYINEAIGEYKKFAEVENAQVLISDLMQPVCDVGDIVSIHEKKRIDLDGMFLGGISDRIEDIKTAQSPLSSRVQPTILEAINSMIRGLMIGGYDITAARPAMGKTTLMLDIAIGLAKTGVPACIISLEMEKSLLYRIIACKLSGANISIVYLSKEDVENMNSFDKANYDKEIANYYDAFESISNMPLYVFDDTDCTNKINGIISFIRQVKKKHGIEFYWVDYLQKIQTSEKFNSRNYEIENISGKLSVLPKQIGIHITAFAQLSRAVETRGGTRRPMMSDLRDGGAIEQDAFNISFLYRPEYYGIERDENDVSTIGLLEVIYAKGRVFGQIGSVELMFNQKTKSYEDIDDGTFLQKVEKEAPVLQETNGSAYNGMITSTAKVDDDENIPF